MATATSFVLADGVPETLARLGFDWQLSYNQWLALLARLDYVVNIMEKPTFLPQRPDYFHARIEAVKESGVPHKLELIFSKDYITDFSSAADQSGSMYIINVSIG